MITQYTRTHLALVFTYYILLTTAYRILIHPKFEYQGFVWRFNPAKFSLGLFVLLLFYLFFLQDKGSVSFGALSVFFIMALTPAAVVYAAQNLPSIRFFYYSGALFSLGFFLRVIPTCSFGRIRIPRVTLIAVLLLLSLMVTAVLIINNGMSWGRAFQFSQTYDIRSHSNYGPRVMYYLVPWVYRVVNIVLILYALFERKYFLLFSALAIQLLIFMSTAHKIILFDLMVVMFIFFISNSRDYIRNLLIAGNAGVIVTFILEKLFTGLRPMISSLVIRRALLLPAQISYQYMEYFDTHIRLFLTHSIFKLFAPSPYSTEIPKVIGEIYYNDVNTWVNTGWIGDAYMNFGPAGIVLFSAALALFLRMMDSMQGRGTKEEALSIVLGALVALMLINGALLTSLLSHGLFLLLVLKWLFAGGSEADAMFD